MQLGALESAVSCKMGQRHHQDLYRGGFSEQSHLWCIKDARELGNAEADPRKRRLVCHADLDTIRDQLEGMKAKVARIQKERAGSSGPFRLAIDKAALALEVARMIDDEGRFVQNVCGDGKVHELTCAAGTVDQWRTKCRVGTSLQRKVSHEAVSTD